MPEKEDTKGYLEVSIEDLNLYFSGTYIKVQKDTDSDFSYHYMIAFGSDRANKFAEFKTPEGKSGLWMLKSLGFDFQFPKTGAYNFLNSVLFFRRRTWRQNKKSLCSGTADIQVAHEKLLQFGAVPELFRIQNSWSWNLKNINSAFLHPKYPSLEEAYNDLLGGEVFARALNRSVSLTQGVDSAGPSVWYETSLVGNVVGKKKIEITNPVFFQEIKDSFAKEDVKIYA